jgi:hypothetical protein
LAAALARRGSLPGMTTSHNPYRGFRFPAEIIQHAVWLYHCFSLSRLRQTGERSARPQRCHLVPKLADLHAAIRDQVIAYPDATLVELRAWTGSG